MSKRGKTVQQLPLETACIELQRAVYEISHNSRKRLGENLQKFVALQGILEAELQLCMMTVQINSLDYVRNNVIALNSVASSSQKQAEEMRQPDEESVNVSHGTEGLRPKPHVEVAPEEMLGNFWAKNSHLSQEQERSTEGAGSRDGVSESGDEIVP
ncbi:hypothetical protein SAPIO_CDS3052 [Scedosporium apiospermum]|uniref:Uncharacterized protein n=1 Tax=Pseudallescheria apiosperma TaxID=563466 RepID=A0A084G9X1_PSEDA|nr:uncharacterized protein SAPIO_CDS3052 [Scedosporium apiospermum]KEZ44133.1 hypothetical protein SAPIO_CDS3052 [Scedosporium apiospermum]